MSPRRVPFFERTRGDGALEPELVEAFRRVVGSGQYVLGAEVETFERSCALRLGRRTAVGVSSGTDALVVALLALGVGPGDEVVCPAYSFFATAGAIARVGARPVFADVDPRDLALDPESAASRLTPRTRAVMVVHLFGRVADTEPLAAMAHARGLPLLEDCAQAFGASRDGRAAGSAGGLGCYSFFPSKNLGAFGDGGLVTTDDPALETRMRRLRVHGAARRHEHVEIGGNYRLDALQAALLGVKLASLDALEARRRDNARRYAELFAARGLGGGALSRDGALSSDGAALLELPEPAPGHTFHQYVVRLRDQTARDALRAHLAERGVGSEIYYPTPLHLQPCFAELGYLPGDLPVAEAAARETLALPIFPELTPDELEYVVDQVAGFLHAE